MRRSLVISVTTQEVHRLVKSFVSAGVDKIVVVVLLNISPELSPIIAKFNNDWRYFWE